MKHLTKLREIRDNMHKKTYLRKLVGADDLPKLALFVVDITKKIDPHSEKDLEEIHHVIFRISTRVMNGCLRSTHFDDKKNMNRFKRAHFALCNVHNQYWEILKHKRTDK